MDIIKVFAANMKRIRKQERLTQEQLAEACNVHRTYIGGIEQGRINVSLKNVGKIADALGVNPALLFVDPGIEEDGPGTKKRAEDESVYYLGIEENGKLSLESLDVDDPDLATQILVSLIQDGYTDGDLAQRYIETKQALLDFYRSSKNNEK